MSGEVTISQAAEHVFRITWHRPPNNFMDADLLRGVADALEELNGQPACRVVILAAEGKHFCAGANVAGRERSSDAQAANTLYEQALRIFRTAKPMVASIQGAAIGGGLGLALAADFRVVSLDARLSANFSRMGYFPGFGLTHTLPRLIGNQHAAHVLYSGERVPGEKAVALGLADRVVVAEDLESAATHHAAALAASGPLSVQAIRAAMRRGLAEDVARALEFERAEQARLRLTNDFAEGVRAISERREPRFTGT